VLGIAEVVREPQDGRLFPAGSAEGLADAMRDVILGRLVRNPEPGLPHSHAQHLERIERLYRELGSSMGDSSETR
jgi:hypothetical protein